MAVEPVFDSPQPPITLTQAEVLAALGISKTTMKTRQRGGILKRLVAEGVLLDTGQPNPDHPEVVAILKSRSTEPGMRARKSFS